MIILVLEKPSDMADSQYAVDFNVKIWDLISLAIDVHEATPITKIDDKKLLGKDIDIAMISNNTGNAITISVNLIIILSINPLKYPDKTPNIIPINKEIKLAVIPINNDMPAPTITLSNTSLPK